MTAVITSSTIESNAYANIYGIMNNRSNIADPRGSSAEERPFIVDSDPLVKSLEFSDYPIIILELPTLEYSREAEDGKRKFIKWIHNITVRTARDGSAGNRVDVGRSDMLAICDDINETFNSLSVRKELHGLNIRKVKIEKVGTDTLAVSQNQLYEATYELTYEIRLQVSP